MTENRPSASACFGTDCFGDAGIRLFHDAPLAVYLRDAQGTLIEVNQALAQLFGYEDPAVFLVATREMPEQFYLDPTSSQDVVNELTREGTLAARQSQVLSRDGLVFWIEETARRVHSAAGDIFYFGYLRDVTREKSIRWALTEAEEKYRAIFEHAVEGLFQMTPRGRFVTVNMALARMLAATAPEQLTQDPESARHLFATPHDWEFLNATLATIGVARGLEVECLRLDGSRFWGSLHVRTIHDGQGQPVLYEGSIEDVTERRRSQEQLRHALTATRALFHQTVKSLATTVRFRDSYTAGHQEKVAKLAAAIARAMQLPNDTVTGIEVAGQLHDIGKISVPVRYLCKPGRLVDLEWECMKQHAVTGYEILRDIAFPWPVAEIAYAHHERLDGTGYPRGLKGEAIVLEARILAVADVLDAMASNRPYRPALGMDAALEELTAHRGTRYDATAVDAARAVIHAGIIRY